MAMTSVIEGHHNSIQKQYNFISRSYVTLGFREMTHAQERSVRHVGDQFTSVVFLLFFNVWQTAFSSLGALALGRDMLVAVEQLFTPVEALQTEFC